MNRVARIPYEIEGYLLDSKDPVRQNVPHDTLKTFDLNSKLNFISFQIILLNLT